jgi:uncharacterized protein YdaU (DUF1376 family)
MNYYPFHLGDYAAHTAHLDPLEDIAYRRLLDAYYLSEAPLQGRPEQLARLIRMREHADVVAQVLVEFFEQEDAGPADSPIPVWRHDRCDVEIEKYRSMLEGGRKGAAIRWAKAPDRGGIGGASGGAIGGVSPPYSPPNANQNQEPRTNTSSSLRSEEDTRKRAKPVPCPEGVSDQVWGSFLTLRRAKKAPVTEAAMAGIVREADKAGIGLEQALEHCCARGWTGFKADWVQQPKAPQPAPQARAPAESFRERDERNARQRWEEMTGRVHPENLQATGRVIDITPAVMPIGALK